MKRILTDKHKFMAYILNKEMGYTMTDIGNLMKVSQSTISNGIRDVSQMIAFRNLQNELAEARAQLAQQGITSPIIEIDKNLLN